MKKQILFVFCLAALVAVISFPTTAITADKAIVLTASATAARDQPVMLGFEAWGKEIEKRTNGRVQFKFFWGASLLKASDNLKGAGQGIADVVFSVPAYHPSDTPFATVSELGYVTKSPDAAARALDALYKKDVTFRNQFERNNVKLMFFVPFPPTIMGFKGKNVTKLDDLQGMKVRALGELNEVLSRLGAVPVAISIQELFESVDRGVINGFTGIPLSAVKATKLDETAKHYIDFGYGNYLTEFVCMNTKKWNSLPADIRKIIEEVNAEGINLYVDLYAKEEAKYVTPLKEAGCTFTILSEEEVAKWKRAVTPAVWDKWVEKNSKYGNARAFYDAYIKEVRNFEAKSTYVNPFPGMEQTRTSAKPVAKPEKGKK